jgi:hypothetical protein
MTTKDAALAALLCGGGMNNAESTPWKVPCENCPLRGKPLFREFSEKELEFVKELKAGELTVTAWSNVAASQVSEGQITERPR